MTAARIAAAQALATLRKFMGKRGVVDKKDGIRGLIASMSLHFSFHWIFGASVEHVYDIFPERQDRQGL